MKDSLLSAYHHDFSCVSETLLKLFAAPKERQLRLEVVDPAKQQAERWYR